MSELIVYGYPQSTYLRTVRMTCVEKGVPYTLDAFESFDFRSATHRELHPFCKMPVLRHDDIVLFETIAICRYIDDAFDGPMLTPEKMLDRHLMEQWISLIKDSVYHRLVRKWMLPLMRKAAESRRDQEKAREQAQETLATLDGMLSRNAYLVGNSVTIADLFLAPILACALQLAPEILSGLPDLARVWAEVSARESFAKTMT